MVSSTCAKILKYRIPEGPGGSMSQVVGLPNNSYKPISNTAWVRARLSKLQKECTRLAASSDKVYQLLAHGRWFSPGTPASSTTKTGRHDIAEILLKVALNTRNQIKSHSRYPNKSSTIGVYITIDENYRRVNTYMLKRRHRLNEPSR